MYFVIDLIHGIGIKLINRRWSSVLFTAVQSSVLQTTLRQKCSPMKLQLAWEGKILCFLQSNPL